MDLQSIGLVLALLGTAWGYKDRLAGAARWAIHGKQAAEEEIALDQRVISTQEKALAAVSTRLEVVERNHTDLAVKYGELKAQYEELAKASEQAVKTAGAERDLAVALAEKVRRILRLALERISTLEGLLTEAGVVHELPPLDYDPADLADDPAAPAA